ncbi:MAG: hypothetical protein FWD42_07970 [Solirubrobacterales bacterium]|nr:hypothetical protein [Solirubrobacterales bacterium]
MEGHRMDGDGATRARRVERRQAALAARRRRLLVLDVGGGALVALVLILLGLGLAPEGLLALGVLIVMALSFALERRRARHRAQPPHAPAVGERVSRSTRGGHSHVSR